MHPNIVASSMNLTGSANIKSGPGIIYSVTVIWDSSSNEFLLRDGTTVSGPVIFTGRRAALAVSGDETQHFIFPGGLKCSVGIAYIRINAIPNATVTYW